MIAVGTEWFAPTFAPIAVVIASTTVGIWAWPAVARAARADIGGPVRASGPDSATGRRWHRRATAIATAVAAAIVAGPIALALAMVATQMVRRLGPLRAARRRRANIERALPDVMDLLVLSVRAGLTPFQAVRDLATTTSPPVSEALAEVVRRTERGQPFADALAALAEHLGPEAGGLADVIATSDRHGLPLGPVLDQLTAEARAARRRLDQAEARKLPVRLSFPLVTCTLPSFVLLAIAPPVIAALSSLGATAW